LKVSRAVVLGVALIHAISAIALAVGTMPRLFMTPELSKSVEVMFCVAVAVGLLSSLWSKTATAIMTCKHSAFAFMALSIIDYWPGGIQPKILIAAMDIITAIALTRLHHNDQKF